MYRSMATDDLPLSAEPRVWLRAFYGFDPEGAGYIGFTNPGDQRYMLDHLREDDLVLIYGAVEDLTAQNLRAQALGFLQVTLEAVADTERMSAASYQWKVDHGFTERWTHGIKVKRAWRIKNRVGIASIAPKAYRPENRFIRTTRAILLEPDERERALSHPVFETSVFGEPPLPGNTVQSGPMERLLRPSRGIKPAFGTRTSVYEDGENTVYLMRFTGKAEALVGTAARPGMTLVKVGRTNDPKSRLGQINFGFPNPDHAGWKLVRQHSYPSGEAAHDQEEALKQKFAEEFCSQSGEFFLGNLAAVETAFHRFCTASSPLILGAPAKAQGAR
jgi:hypothetical protein